MELIHLKAAYTRNNLTESPASTQVKITSWNRYAHPPFATLNSRTPKLSSLIVCGLKQRLNIPKFLDYVNKYDIVYVSEIHRTNIDGYSFIAKHKTQHYKRKTGAGIYVLITLNIM